jgi:hypothetical protein
MRLYHRLDGPEDAPVPVFSNSIATTLQLWDAQQPEAFNRAVLDHLLVAEPEPA